MSSILIIGCIIAFTCIFHSTRLINNARGELAEEELEKVDAETRSGVHTLLLPLVPLLIAYLLQNQVPLSPLFLFFGAFLASIVIVWKQSMDNLKHYQSIGISDRFVSAHNRANIIRWVGLIIFMISFLLTKIGTTG